VTPRRLFAILSKPAWRWQKPPSSRVVAMTGADIFVDGGFLGTII
jgi:hypothetical protein